MISYRNLIRASRRNIELASLMLADPVILKAEAKRITGDARKTGWLRRDAKLLLAVCEREGLTVDRPYKIAPCGDHQKTLLTAFWPDNARVVLVPAVFFTQ